MKEQILGLIPDLISGFLYYDRKEDENVTRDTIQNAIKNGDITIEEIVEKFKEELINGL